MATEEYDDSLILGRYRPISEAGSGGYGTVIAAWDIRIQRRVAIKMMRLGVGEDGMLDESVAKAGLDEARTAAMLSDSHIVGVLDFEVQGDTAYLIMEYVDGITLTQFMRDWGDYMDDDIVASIFQDVSHALEVAHDNQVLHLDIKPDNILINRKGEAKVTDFGLAKLSDAAGFSHAGGGTIGYMPLEQMRLEALDARCDEWALASIVYQMISGENPFLARDLDAAQAAITNAELILPSLCMESLDEEIDDVLFYALDPDRDGRYNTVREFANALQPLLGNPARGRKQLARIVGQAREDMPDEAVITPDAPTRVGERSMNNVELLMRIWSVVGAGLLSFVALANNAWIPGMQSPYFIGILAVIVVVAAAIPNVGALLACLALAVTFASCGYYAITAVVAVASLLWWYKIARDAKAQTNTGISSVIFGAVGLNHFVPLITGYYLDAGQAFFNTLFASMLAVLLAAFGSGDIIGWWPSMYWDGLGERYLDVLISILRDPSTWITIGSWGLATLVMGACGGRGTKAFGILGALLGGIILIAGVVGCTWVASGFTNFRPPLTSVAIAAVCALAAVVVNAIKAPAVD